VRLLTDDAVSVADGGGQVPARSTPIVGALRIARFLRGLFRPTEARRGLVETAVGAGVELHVADVNGTAAVLVTSGDRVVGVLAPDVTPAGVAALNIQVAPAKLERISRQWAATEHGAPFATPW
jgi:RNA polymerase sigma-70 factor (ECF subfamily)